MSAFGKSLSWMGLAVVVSKLSSIITQVVLGYLLLAEQFGMYAFLVGGMGLIAGFIDTGISKLLIRAQEEMERYQTSAILITSGMAMTGSFLLLLYVWLKEMPQEVWSAALSIALSLPIYALAQIDKARLSIALELPFISRVEVSQALLHSAVLMLMAFAGYGVEGFGVATAVGYCFVAINFRLGVRRRISVVQFTKEQKFHPGALLWELRWLILTTFAMGFALRGDYVVLGNLISTTELGVYYFAFMLTANVGLLIAAGINSAFMPFLAKKLGKPAELRSFFLENALMFLFLTAVLAGGFICLGGTFVHWIWQGRWDAAVWPAIMLAITLPLKILAPVSYALLEAWGMWQKRFLLVTADAVTVALAVALGAKMAGLTGAVVALAIQRGIIGSVIFVAACQWSGTRMTYHHIVAPLFAVALMGLLAGLGHSLPQYVGEGVGLLVLISVALAALPSCAPSLHRRVSGWKRKWIV